MIVFGADICPGCVEAKRVMAEKNIEHTFIDITESTANLKKFLRLRDTREEFDDVKKNGKIGIPCFLMADNRIVFELEEI